MSEPSREQLNPPGGISIHFDSSKNYPILVREIAEVHQVPSLEDVSRVGEKHALYIPLSNTRMDGKLLSHESTRITFDDYTHPSNTWQGLTVRPSSEVVHVVKSGEGSPYNKERAEKIREMLFNKGYRSNIEEMPVHIASSQRERRSQRIFELLSQTGNNELMRALTKRVKDGAYWILSVPISNESQFRVTLGESNYRDILTTVEFEPVINHQDPYKPRTFISDTGEERTMDPDSEGKVVQFEIGDKQFLPRRNTSNAEGFSIASEQTFARMMQKYNMFYKNLLESLYDEANLQPSVNININVGSVNIV